MLEDVKISVENRIKELEETQDIYKIEMYSNGLGDYKHLEIYYKGKPYMCVPACIIKKRLTPKYIGYLKIVSHDIKHNFYLYPQNRKVSPGKFSDIEHLTKTYHIGKDYTCEV